MLFCTFYYGLYVSFFPRVSGQNTGWTSGINSFCKNSTASITSTSDRVHSDPPYSTWFEFAPLIPRLSPYMPLSYSLPSSTYRSLFLQVSRCIFLFDSHCQALFPRCNSPHHYCGCHFGSVNSKTLVGVLVFLRRTASKPVLLAEFSIIMKRLTEYEWHIDAYRRRECPRGQNYGLWDISSNLLASGSSSNAKQIAGILSVHSRVVCRITIWETIQADVDKYSRS